MGGFQRWRWHHVNRYRSSADIHVVTSRDAALMRQRETPVATEKFLLVDDEPHVTHLLSYKLRQEGIDVITAQDGEQAYRIACEKLPDLVITDLQMPVFTGYEMSVKLRTNSVTAHIPVLMLTARGHILSDEELASTNIKRLISKPFSARELISVAKALVGASCDFQQDHSPGSIRDQAGKAA